MNLMSGTATQSLVMTGQAERTRLPAVDGPIRLG